MLLSGTKRSYEVTGESNSLTKDLKKFLKKRKVAMLYHYKNAKILSDKQTCEIGQTTYREMIVRRGDEYACVSYIKGSDDPPDILVAYPRPEKYKKHV